MTASGLQLRGTPSWPVFLILTLLVAYSGCGDSREAPELETVREDSVDEAHVEAFIDELLARMTVQEKLGQLTQSSWSESMAERFPELAREGRVGSVLNLHGAAETRAAQRVAVEESRLGIPLLFAMDVIHGMQTVFPVPLAEAASWNPHAVQEAARVSAFEAAASGLHWTFAPMVDIARDARWGRIVEGSGEDPYLGMVMAAARVRGFQGEDLSDPLTVMACAKHMAAYGGAEGGRDYNTVDISERTLREVYLPPFHAAVDAGVATIMSAFNEISGTPSTINPLLFEDILRDTWGFEGFVVSDWGSIGEVLMHGVGRDREDVGVMALLAGIDVDMMSGTYARLESAVAAGRLPEDELDESVRRVLRAKYRLGLFHDPYRYSDLARERRYVRAPEHLAKAREMARQAVVLLKNDDNVLPLSRSTTTLAVIGPLADDDDAPLGPWAKAGRPADVVNVLEGIRRGVSPQTTVVHARGADIDSQDTTGFDSAVEAARQADAVILVLGESRDMSGEAASRSDIGLPGVQRELAEAIISTGKPTVAVLLNGRPMATPWLARHVPAIVEAWYLGVQTGPAVADVLFGEYNPSGRLTVSVPRTTGQIPLYYNHKMTGRPAADHGGTSKYMDVEPSPLFPFGHGLSYTTFEYDGLSVSDRTIPPDGTMRLGLTVTNTGRRTGTETVQLYLRDVKASVTKPVMELKGFHQVALEPGETREVRFEVPVAMLAHYNRDMEFVVEPGTIEIMVGRSAGDIRLKDSFEIRGQLLRVEDVPRYSASGSR